MEDDPNAVLKDIAAMSGMHMEDPDEKTPDEQEAMPDEQGQEEEQAEEQATEEGVQVEEKAEEDVELSVEDRYAALLEAHNALSAQMLELQTRGYPVGSPPDSAQVVTPPAAQVPTPPPAQPSTYALDEKLLEKALIEDDPAAMKQVIGGLVQHMEVMVQAAREQTREAVLRDLPGVASSVARHQLVLAKAVEQFYVDNQDLAPFQHVVGAVGQEISMKEPNLSILEALEKTGVEVRRRLGLRKQAQKLEADRKPAFPKGGSGSRKPGAPTLTGKRADIAAMQSAKY